MVKFGVLTVRLLSERTRIKIHETFFELQNHFPSEILHSLHSAKRSRIVFLEFFLLNDSFENIVENDFYKMVDSLCENQIVFSETKFHFVTYH